MLDLCCVPYVLCTWSKTLLMCTYSSLSTTDQTKVHRLLTLLPSPPLPPPKSSSLSKREAGVNKLPQLLSPLDFFLQRYIHLPYLQNYPPRLPTKIYIFILPSRFTLFSTLFLPPHLFASYNLPLSDHPATSRRTPLTTPLLILLFHFRIPIWCSSPPLS